MSATTSIIRRRDMRQVQSAYTRKFRWCRICIYCGMYATCLDHVFPLSRAAGLDLFRPSVRRELKQGLNLVPACRECNSLAGAKLFTSIRQKRDYIQKRLRRRKASVLNISDWEDDEMARMSHSMKSFIRLGLREREQTLFRLNWPWSREAFEIRQRRCA